jgi:cytochrome c oxidase subunit 2
MTIQLTAALISFVGIAALAGIYLFILSSSGEEAPYPEVQPRAYRVRKQLFYVLLVGFFLLPAVTLRSTPYSASADAAGSTIVDVTAHQWYWVMSQSEVPANRPVVFRVGSEDVNHGFGIYNEANRLIAQVQAMPGYVNQLAVEFDTPGTYKIMCLEYCGFVHHVMISEIKVVAEITDQEGI